MSQNDDDRASVSIHRFDLDAHGLARVVGELQARILEAVWAKGSTTVKDVAESLGAEHHPKTVMTVMNRMVEKGLLCRVRHGRAYTYRAAADRETFMDDVARQVVEGLLADFGGPTLAHFVETINPEQHVELEALLRRRQRA